MREPGDTVQRRGFGCTHKGVLGQQGGEGESVTTCQLGRVRSAEPAGGED